MNKTLLPLALMATFSNHAPLPCYSHVWMQPQSSDFSLRRIYASAMQMKKGKKMNLTAQDSGRSLNVPLHATLSIELGENPTTGYRWQILDNGAPVLRVSKDSFQRGSSSAVGAGGSRVLEFVTENTGAASLRIGYARPGDPASLKNEFLLHVQVSPT